jgi:dienelactone hydrolase
MLFRTRLDPLEISIDALVEGRLVAGAVARRLSVAPDVRRTEVRERGLVGTLFEPADVGPRPGVIVLGGSGGGLSESLAALLGSRGVAALALAYFAMPGLPEELGAVPLEYFETALDWLGARPGVRADALATLGSSRGGELALLLGATFPSVRCVVAYAPSAVVYGSVRKSGRSGDGAWLHRGQAVPWFRPTRAPAADVPAEAALSDAPFALTPTFLAGLKDTEAVEQALIPVERIRGPVLMVSGKDDQMWPSSVFAEMVMKRLERNRHPYRYEHLSYSDCGHLLNFPYVPTTVSASIHPVTGNLFAYGGTASGQAKAREDSWPKVVAFLRDSLR